MAVIVTSCDRPFAKRSSSGLASVFPFFAGGARVGVRRFELKKVDALSVEIPERSPKQLFGKHDRKGFAIHSLFSKHKLLLEEFARGNSRSGIVNLLSYYTPI
jgi:hypothetical protein